MCHTGWLTSSKGLLRRCLKKEWLSFRSVDELNGFERRVKVYGPIKKHEPRFDAAKERAIGLDRYLPSQWRIRSWIPLCSEQKRGRCQVIRWR